MVSQSMAKQGLKDFSNSEMVQSGKELAQDSLNDAVEGGQSLTLGGEYSLKDPEYCLAYGEIDVVKMVGEFRLIQKKISKLCNYI